MLAQPIARSAGSPSDQLQLPMAPPPPRQMVAERPLLPSSPPLPAMSAGQVSSSAPQLPPLSAQVGRSTGAAAPAPPPPPPPPMKSGGGVRAPPPPPPPPPAGGLSQLGGQPPRAPAPPTRTTQQNSAVLQVYLLRIASISPVPAAKAMNPKKMASLQNASESCAAVTAKHTSSADESLDEKQYYAVTTFVLCDVINVCPEQLFELPRKAVCAAQISCLSCLDQLFESHAIMQGQASAAGTNKPNAGVAARPPGGNVGGVLSIAEQAAQMAARRVKPPTVPVAATQSSSTVSCSKIC